MKHRILVWVILPPLIALPLAVAAHYLGLGPHTVQVRARVDAEENEATRMTSLGRCGIERWAVKTLKDPAARQVSFQASPTTVAAMNALPAPSLPHDNTTRLATERQSFRLTAVLVKYKLEADEDIHLVLSDGGFSMIAEMPANTCDYGAQKRWAMLVARQTLESRFGVASDRWAYVNQPVTVTGVRFFDFNHGQTGVADNAVELHPVWRFRG